MTVEAVVIKQEETIAAISTPVGEGGIGMVRLSGETALSIIGEMYRGQNGKPRSNFESHRVYYGFIVGERDERIDEALVTVMLSPKTYTREDVVEISCHGGMAVLRKTLNRALDLGARPAEPGEFSKRAFLNGRIDLVQAEAIIDLIRSKSEKGWKTAFSQLDGKLSELLGLMEDKLVEIIAEIEASIDFPDEELEIIENQELLQKLQILQDKTTEITGTYGAGRIYRDGVTVAIAGRPNVGKSSLMNALLQRDRVIVTETPGTTRDTVEETLQIAGVEMRIVDTAGVREAIDAAERLGIERTMETVREAEAVLLIIDGSKSLTSEDRGLIEEIGSGNVAAEAVIAVVNKIDKGTKIDVKALQANTGFDAVAVSAKTGEGLNDLKERLAAEVEKFGEPLGDGPVLTRERHLHLLRDMSKSVLSAMTAIDRGMSREFIAADLLEAKESLEELTGKAVDEQVIEKIFNEFCIGK